MASALTHAAVPLLVGRLIPLPPGLSRRRLAVVSVLVACAADLDVLAPVFDVPPDGLLAHRGLLHSLPFAAALAALAAVAFFRGPALRAAFGLLFLAAASHGLIDTLTRGDVGVALLAPFSDARVLLPFRPLLVCPLGVDEYASIFGFLVLANELVVLVLPLAIGTEVIRRFRDQESFAPVTGITVVWLASATALWLRAPSLWTPAQRVINGFGAAGGDEDLRWIPTDSLPDRRLLTRFDDLKGLFNRTLEPKAAPWSSTFFPAWYGAEAGRWQDSRLTLVRRTLFGTRPPDRTEALAALDSNHAAQLAPTEKYDLAHADYGFPVTQRALTITHNAAPHPRFWFGLCSGVAAAATQQPEPYRTVDVTSPDGHVVRFLPLDVKALLAKAYYWTENTGVLGGNCDVITFDSGRTCSMNPAGLAIATLNYLGRGGRSFLIDVYPTIRAQNYAVVSARVALDGDARAVSNEPVDPALAGRVSTLVDVAFDVTLSSTTLPLTTGGAPTAEDPTRFAKVGVHPIAFHWLATLAMDRDGELIGGRWRGDPPDGPDDATFVEGGPLLDGGTHLDVEPLIDWSFIEALARASTDDGPATPTLVVDSPAR